MSGGRRKEEPPQPQLANGALKVSVWSKVLRSDAAWEDKVRWDLGGLRLEEPAGTWGQMTGPSLRQSPSGRGRESRVVGRVASGCKGELGGPGPDSRGRGSPPSGLRVKPPRSRGKRRGGGREVATRGRGVCLNGES